MHPEDIRAGIRKKYGTLRAFERAFGLPNSSTRDVLRGRSVKRTAAAIASVLDIKDFTIVKTPKSSIMKSDCKSLKRDCHGLNAEAK